MQATEYEKFYTEDYINKFKTQSIFKISRLVKYFDLDKSDIVADFACGDGKLAKLINSKVKEYHGIDFSQEFINEAENAHKKEPNVFFHCDDIINFSKNNPNKFNKAFSLDFTEHIYDEDFKKIFGAIKKSLRNKGKLYIHTPNGNYFIEILKKIGILKQFPEHVAVRNANQNLKILKEIGFSNIEVKYLPHYNKLLEKLHFLSYIPFFGKFFKARLFLICSN